MTNYDLPNNYIKNLEALLRKKQSCGASASANPPTDILVTPAPSATPINGQDTPRLLHPHCCQRARWAGCQHRQWKLRAPHQPHHDGVGKPGNSS